jgi:hypothetical protein
MSVYAPTALSSVCAYGLTVPSVYAPMRNAPRVTRV